MPEPVARDPVECLRGLPAGGREQLGCRQAHLLTNVLIGGDGQASMGGGLTPELRNDLLAKKFDCP